MRKHNHDSCESLPPLLSKDEEIDLAKRIEQGDLAAEAHFVAANQRLVISMAARWEGRGLGWEDLCQEGNIGLLKAVRKFDWRRGNRFSTHAVWWIRQTISRAVMDKGTIIRIPVYYQKIINAIRNADTRLFQKLDRPPTAEEIAREAGVSLDMYEDALRITQPTVSLDITVGEENTLPLHETLRSYAMQEDTMDRLDHQAVLQLLRPFLEEREWSILCLRHGINHSRGQSLAEVGAVFHLTRERVRQIEQRAMEKLRTLPVRRLIMQHLA